MRTRERNARKVGQCASLIEGGGEKSRMEFHSFLNPGVRSDRVQHIPRIFPALEKGVRGGKDYVVTP